MTDIFRQELDIPEKPKTFGWIFILLGGILLILALVAFYQEQNLVDRLELQSQQMTTAANPPAASETKDKSTQITRARQYLWLVIVALGLVMIFVLGATLSHRIALHLNSDRSRRSKTTFTDPWRQAGERMQTPPPHDE